MDQLSRQIKVYEKILADGVWNKTPLLGVYADRMRLMLNKMVAATKVASESTKDHGYVNVFVVLYHQQGRDPIVWEKMLMGIKSSVQSRPVFMEKRDAEACISDHRFESFVQLWLPKSSVMLCEGSHYIRFSAVTPETVKCFFWQGKSYQFNDLRLIEIAAPHSD